MWGTQGPTIVGPGAHGKSLVEADLPIIVGPGAHGKSLVEADLPIGAVSMSPNRKIRLLDI